VQSSFMKGAVFVLSCAVAGCAGQGGQSLPQGSPHTTQSPVGPALAPPALRQPMDVVGGPTTRTYLGDAPPMLFGKTLAHFYVGVREIDAIANGQSVTLGSSATPLQMDLLAYQNGSADWMTQTNVPAQSYSQLRYVLDLNSTQAVFTDGTSVPVAFSGAGSRSSSGMGASTTTTSDQTYANAIDVTVNTAFAAGASITADFNLGESLTASGNMIVMRPALSAANGAGQITGSVMNAYGQPVLGATVVAVGSSGYAVNSGTTSSSGAFDIDALPADTYRLLIYNAYTNAAGYKSAASGQTNSAQGFYGPSVTLSAGSSTSAGTIGD